MLDYKNAEHRSQGRLDKFLGRKVTTWTWIKYDSERDCYILSYVSNVAWKTRPQKDGTDKACRGPKEEWEMFPIAEIYRDRVVVLVNQTYASLLWKLFDLNVDRQTSIMSTGSIWYMKNGYENRAIGDAPVTIKNGKITCAVKSKHRVFNTAKKNQLNAMIQKVRRMIKVRHKLGLITASMLPPKIKTDIINSVPNLAAALDNAREDSLDSLLHLLAFTDGSKIYISGTTTDGTWAPGTYKEIKDDMLYRFNTLITSKREELRKHYGTVAYK